MEEKKPIEEEPVQKEAEEVGVSEEKEEEIEQPKVTIQEYLANLEQRLTYVESVMFRNTKE